MFVLRLRKLLVVRFNIRDIQDNLFNHRGVGILVELVWSTQYARQRATCTYLVASPS